jgi:putative transposase
MPRLPRLVAPAVPMHVIHRGNNRSRMFRDSVDYRWFRNALMESCRREHCAIHAYVFMPNHVHLLLTPTKTDGPARMMQQLGRRYVRYFNDRHKRTGTLWEGRFHSSVIDSERYFFTCSRYIELNPVRASMVGRPSDYRWSSFHANGSGEHDSLITPHELYERLHSTRRGRVTEYRGLFSAHIARDMLDAIRLASRRGAPLGDAEFRSEMQRRRAPPGTRFEHGGDRRSRGFAGHRLPRRLDQH